MDKKRDLEIFEYIFWQNKKFCVFLHVNLRQ